MKTGVGDVQDEVRTHLLEYRRLVAIGDAPGAAAAHRRAFRAVWRMPIGHSFVALPNTPRTAPPAVKTVDLFDRLRDAVTSARAGEPYDRDCVRAVTALLSTVL